MVEVHQDCAELPSSEFLAPSNEDQPARVTSEGSPSRTGVYREGMSLVFPKLVTLLITTSDPQSCNPGSPADTHSFFTPGGYPAMPRRSHSEGGSIQENVTWDKPGTTQVNGSLSAFQSFNTEIIGERQEICYPHNWTRPAGQGENPFSAQSGTSQNLVPQSSPTFRSFDRAMMATGGSTTAQSTVNNDRSIISSDHQDLEQGNESRKRKRQFSRRTKTGCLTCRQKKIKCDEQKPLCMRTFFFSV